MQATGHPLVAHADGSHGGVVFSGICLSVSVESVVLRDISKNHCSQDH